MKDAAQQILCALKVAGTPEKAAILQRFFKTGPGEYGEGDCFLGVSVPATRAIAKANANTPFAELAKLLRNPFHEARLCALLVLVERFRTEKHAPRERQRIFEFYLAHARRCNNWDLVDLTAPKIVGEFLAESAGTPETNTRNRELLLRLAESECLWEQRIAVVSALAFIRRNDFSITFKLAEKLAPHPHDLMRKANGWMLREVGKRSRAALSEFLETHASTLPRTTLRYAIEHYTPAERARWRAL